MNSRIYQLDISATLLPVSEKPPSGRYVAVTAATLELPDGLSIAVYQLSAASERADEQPLEAFWLKKFPYFNPILSGYDLINEPVACSGYLLALTDPSRRGEFVAYSNDVECSLLPA